MSAPPDRRPDRLPEPAPLPETPTPPAPSMPPPAATTTGAGEHALASYSVMPLARPNRQPAAGVAARDDQDLTATAGVMELPEPRGYQVRRKRGRAARAWYAPSSPPALTSTRQAEILNTAIVAASTSHEGTVIGRDRLSNTPVAHDPFTAYERSEISSPAVVVLGVVGSGKSSLLKTVYIMRPQIMRNRRAVIMDKKDKGGEGEYAPLCRAYGAEPLRMVVGQGGTRLNIMDPLVLAGHDNTTEGGRTGGQVQLLVALAELANNSEPLEKWERAALRHAFVATRAACEADGRVPILGDLMQRLGGMDTADTADYSAGSKERYHQAGLGVRHLLEGMLADELSGLFDGPTSREVRLEERLTVFDISQLPDEGPAASMVMTVANVWLLGTLRHQRGLRTNFIAEEGWDLVGGPGGRVFQRNSKLARGLGLSNIAAIHHVADIPPHDPAIAMLKEAQTVHLYRQDRADDIEAVVSLYGLDPGARHSLEHMPDGHHLLKIGARREILVEHVRSRLERDLTNTDEAMTVLTRDNNR